MTMHDPSRFPPGTRVVVGVDLGAPGGDHTAAVVVAAHAPQVYAAPPPPVLIEADQSQVELAAARPEAAAWLSALRDPAPAWEYAAGLFDLTYLTWYAVMRGADRAGVPVAEREVLHALWSRVACGDVGVGEADLYHLLGRGDLVPRIVASQMPSLEARGWVRHVLGGRAPAMLESPQGMPTYAPLSRRLAFALGSTVAKARGAWGDPDQARFVLAGASDPAAYAGGIEAHDPARDVEPWFVLQAAVETFALWPAVPRHLGVDPMADAAYRITRACYAARLALAEARATYAEAGRRWRPYEDTAIQRTREPWRTVIAHVAEAAELYFRWTGVALTERALAATVTGEE